MMRLALWLCLLLEADGFAERGKGWQMAAEGKIGRKRRLPIATMGGLKARGHPTGATALIKPVKSAAADQSGRAESD